MNCSESRASRFRVSSCETRLLMMIRPITFGVVLDRMYVVMRLVRECATKDTASCSRTSAGIFPSPLAFLCPPTREKTPETALVFEVTARVKAISYMDRYLCIRKQLLLSYTIIRKSASMAFWRGRYQRATSKKTEKKTRAVDVIVDSVRFSIGGAGDAVL